MQFIDLGAQQAHIRSGIERRIQEVLNHRKFILGPEVDELEEKLAEYVGVKHALTCANGTDALQLTLMAAGIKSGDAVFVPTFTFFASAEVVPLVGATPIFIDVERETFNIDPAHLEHVIQKILEDGRVVPKAIIAVDLFGLPANYQELNKIAKKYGLILIEDAAQGFGGSINGEKAGSFGDMATTSFFPAKPLGCYGDGGAVFTDNDDYAELIKSFRVHGQGSDKYDNVRIGLNSRLDTFQAAILLEKLTVFPVELISRARIAEVYSAALSEFYEVPRLPVDYSSAWAQYTILSGNRDQLASQLKSHGVPTMIYYPKCLHQQTAFKGLVPEFGLYPVAESMSELVLGIPMHPYLEEKDIGNIVSILKSKLAC